LQALSAFAIHFDDKESYDERKIESELKKRGSTKVDKAFVKCKKKKWSTVFRNNREFNGT
jgi:hypothetical protein